MDAPIELQNRSSRSKQGQGRRLVGGFEMSVSR